MVFSNSAGRDHVGVLEGMADAYRNEFTPAVRDAEIALDDLQLIIAGPVGKANDDYIWQQADLRLKIIATTEELDKLKAKHGQVVTVTNDTETASRELVIAQFDAQKAAENLGKAQEALTEDPGDLGLLAAVARAELSLADSQVKLGEWQTAASTESETFTTNYSKDIAATEERLGELNEAFDANAKAHREATARIIFDMTVQRLAEDGFQEGELGFLATIGQAWGIYDKATATALGNVDSALAESGGNAETFLGIMQGVYDLPDKHITITTEYRQIGTIPDFGIYNTPAPLPAGPEDEIADGRLQHGGAFGRGPILVGEGGPELLFPRGSGYVMNNSDSSRLIGAMERIVEQLGDMGRPNSSFNFYGGNLQLSSELRRILSSGSHV